MTSKSLVAAKTKWMALAFVALLSCASAESFAASEDELTQIRSQLLDLIERVERLEQQNRALQAENDRLRTDSEYLKEETRGLRKDTALVAGESAKVKGADWASRVSIKGDFRYRHEQIGDDALTSAGVSAADRERDRIRARVNLQAKATDAITVGVGIATTEGGDPRGSNQTLDGTFSRKSFDLDLAYLDWKFSRFGLLTAGKMKQPFPRPGQSLFWDGDVNPEGLAVSFERGMWFGGAYNFWVDEVSGPETALTADAHLAGAHVGARIPVGDSTLMLGAHYYDLGAGQGRRGLLFNCSATSNACANGNTTIGPAGEGVLAHDFEVAEVYAEISLTAGTLPLQVWADLAQNQAPVDLDTAWAAGIRLGAAGDYRTWELGALYQVVEKDALFAQVIDSDFAGGVSDSKGWVLRAGYAPVRNWLLNASYYINEVNVDVANSAGQRNVDYERLQLDLNVKF
ncbi:MAG TPA: putative porin [Steroidobacter sp.]